MFGSTGIAAIKKRIFGEEEFVLPEHVKRAIEKSNAEIEALRNQKPVESSVAVLEAPDDPIGVLTKKAAAGKRNLTARPVLEDFVVLDDEMKRIDSMGGPHLLPIERQSVAMQKSESRRVAISKFLDARYDRLDLDILKWRRKNKMPVFGVFDPFSEKSMYCTISVRRGTMASLMFDRDRKPEYDVEVGEVKCPELSKYFDDLESGHYYYASYSGILPDNVRSEMIELRQAVPGLKIEVVAECEWEKHVIPEDPLVIARAFGSAWLVACFDLTPIENIAKSEFAFKAGAGDRK